MPSECVDGSYVARAQKFDASVHELEAEDSSGAESIIYFNVTDIRSAYPLSPLGIYLITAKSRSPDDQELKPSAGFRLCAP
jgi:hypothetical protein